MTATIQTLPAEVVHLIAAGEVIDSLAAVVRELVENSLDAGATRIIVSIRPEQWQVQVADNGMGMDLENLQQAATAHSTSKINSAKDLWKITTLGFRGEALHSLAQLACLEIASRENDFATPIELRFESNKERPQSTNKDLNSGWRIVYNNVGEPREVEAIAIAPGTVVTVSNLFGSWPVRRGFVSPAQQLRAVQLMLQQIAVCHPRVTWQIRQGDNLVLHISPGVTAKETLPQILRGVRLSDLQQLTLEVSPPLGSGGGGELLSRGAGELLSGGAGELLSGGALPITNYQLPITNYQLPITNYQLPAQSLDLVIGLPDRCHRRRPDWVKVAVNGRVVRSPELEQTILTAFGRTCPRDRYPICFIHFQIYPEQIDWNRHPAKAEIYLHNMIYWQEQISLAIARALQLNTEIMPEMPLPERVGKLLKASEQKSGYNVNRSIQPNADGEAGKNSSDLGLMELKAIAQVHNTYILAEHPSGMWLVEQHIAHERVLYEQLCYAWQLVPLEPPVILNQLSPTQVDNLQRLGLEIEPFGEQLWAARSAPALLAKRDDCQDALTEISKVGDLQTAQVATACRSAIRNGTTLTLQEMQTLLDRWKSTRNPRTCPHGRPIFLSLEESALARFFRRNWVIGKSHGI
ncbi:DNA mismatch repair endonuclease MutL [Kamptonema sp. UHCC 0994]|uniref:DNA mismatch repair endonuclease MutL n=1 Tax=Kamptonema sp. UHCC 0994 TaxID=3031329 RepID=UPI0023B9264D|nr:DNA mismatch repair endonuclease MutL [Kamptonema sp. UHCC 0994]MDF0554991.1 DNA mismatch repair endonuclease MutL [Kamptonema sp. UHCC 0994]